MLNDAKLFSDLFAAAKREHFDKTISREVSKPKNRQNTSKITAAARLAKLWRMSGAANSVTAVLTENGSTAHDPHSIVLEVGAVWARTFSEAGILPSEAYEFLSSLNVSWPCADVKPPSMEAIAHFLAHLKDSSPGPDGIPYSCYKAHLACSASLFFWATLVLLSGRILYLHFNCLLLLVHAL